MQGFFGRPWSWAAAAPALCAVHCAATPLLLVAVPALALWRGVELTLLTVTAALAIVALSVGFRRHRRVPPLLAAGGGLMLWGASAGHLIHGAPETLTTMAGAMVVAGALLRNSQLLCRSREPECGCVVCEEPEDAIDPEVTAPSPGEKQREPGLRRPADPTPAPFSVPGRGTTAWRPKRIPTEG